MQVSISLTKLGFVGPSAPIDIYQGFSIFHDCINYKNKNNFKRI